jgi:hypothetical protein
LPLGFTAEELENLRGSDDPELRALLADYVSLLEDNPLLSFEPIYEEQHSFLRVPRHGQDVRGREQVRQDDYLGRGRHHPGRR